MKKKYLAPHIKAHKVHTPTILAGSQTINVNTDPDKKTSSMLSKATEGFEDFEDE